MSFGEKLRRAIEVHQSHLCVGLDPDLARMPIRDVVAFNRAIIAATQDLVCAYKPNLAFYEALGVAGMQALQETITAVPPHIPVIADAKRGDISPSADAYARALFEVLGCDAATVNPYLGGDALEPFLRYADRGVFVLCHTSNPGSADFQELRGSEDGLPLYERVALQARAWNRHGNVGLVAGATYPGALRRLRQLCPEMPLLVPGIGAQGGDLAAVLGEDEEGPDQGARGPMIINMSRAILYASSGPDFAQAARAQALFWRDEIRHLRTAGSTPLHQGQEG